MPDFIKADVKGKTALLATAAWRTAPLVQHHRYDVVSAFNLVHEPIPSAGRDMFEDVGISKTHELDARD